MSKKKSNTEDATKKIDEICDQFERDFRNGQHVEIASLLGSINASIRPELLCELLALELELAGQNQVETSSRRVVKLYPDLQTECDEWRRKLSTGNSDTFSASQPDIQQNIGPYRLREQLGSGGMGSVWLADQTSPVQRQVAVKIIKAGLDSKEVFARFEAERQALAMMDHPNIARILDAGTTESGQPFFAMEWVKGVPITEYCDRHQLTVNARLEIFRDICRGVQHAHQKGIIHRDLKPSNILVAEYNGKPVPKIIDFGLAKALKVSSRLTDKTLFTEFGQVLGTLVYMSPEQAELDSLDIDTRSDIYSLGVVLYELLTGTTPIEKGSFINKAVLEVLSLVRELDSPRPSLRVESSDLDSLASISKDRRTDKRKLKSILQGDLDWITLKALEKDRNRRYSTAVGFSDDIQRYLDSDVVVARPPSVTYRISRFAKRNRGLLTAVSIIAFCLLAGIISTSTVSVWALGQRAEAIAAQAESDSLAAEKTKLLDEAKVLADEKSALAEKMTQLADRKQKIIDGFVAAFRSANPDRKEVDSNMSARDFLLQAANRTRSDEGLAKDPLAKASLLSAIGQSLSELGEYESALGPLDECLKLREKHLPPDAFEIRQVMNNMADCLLSAGRSSEAAEMGKKALQLYRDFEGDSDPDTLVVAANLAHCYTKQGNYELAIPLYEQTLNSFVQSLGKNHLKTIKAKNHLAVAHFQSGAKKVAISLFEEILDQRNKILGENHPETLISRGNLAAICFNSGKYERAIELALKTIEGQTLKHGEDHPSTLNTKSTLAAAYELTNQYDLAEKAYRDVLKLSRKRLGDRHPFTLTCLNNLAVGLKSMGKVEDALLVYDELLRLQSDKLGPLHPSTLLTLNNLARASEKAEDFEKAEQTYLKSIDGYTTSMGKTHPKTLFVKRNYALMLERRLEFAKASPLREEILLANRANVDCPPEKLAESLNELAHLRQLQGQLDESIKLYAELRKMEFELFGKSSLRNLNSLLAFQNVLAQKGSTDRTIETIDECLKLLAMQSPVDQSLVDHLKIAKAEALATDGRLTEGMKILEQVDKSQELSTLDAGRIHFVRGMVYEGNGDLELAASELSKAAEMLVENKLRYQPRFRWVAHRVCDKAIKLYSQTENEEKRKKIELMKNELDDLPEVN